MDSSSGERRDDVVGEMMTNQSYLQKINSNHYFD